MRDRERERMLLKLSSLTAFHKDGFSLQHSLTLSHYTSYTEICTHRISKHYDSHVATTEIDKTWKLQLKSIKLGSYAAYTHTKSLTHANSYFPFKAHTLQNHSLRHCNSCHCLHSSIFNKSSFTRVEHFQQRTQSLSCHSHLKRLLTTTYVYKHLSLKFKIQKWKPAVISI